MAKYVSKNKDQPLTSVSLAGKEYKAEDGVITIPDDHHDAHKAAEMAGLEHAPSSDAAPAKEGTGKTSTK